MANRLLEDVSDAEEGSARDLDAIWARSFAFQGTWKERPLPPPDCVDMLAPPCDRYAAREH